MKHISTVGTQTFSWRPVKGVKNTIELYADNDVFATLYQKRGQPSVAETAGGSWTIESRKGTVTARTTDGTVVATFISTKGGQGTVTTADGSEFQWLPTHKGQAERAFYNASGERIVRFWKDTQLFKAEDRGAADAGMSEGAEFPLLVIMGRCIGIGMDDATMVAVIVAAT